MKTPLAFLLSAVIFAHAGEIHEAAAKGDAGRVRALLKKDRQLLNTRDFHTFSDPVKESPSQAAAESVPEPPQEPEITALLAQLQSDDLDTRYAAMRNLGPSIDPRVPDACLSVLKKEGGEFIDHDDQRILWNPATDRFSKLPSDSP